MHERESCNARRCLVRARHATVNNQRMAAAFHGAFSVLHFYGNMPVNNAVRSGVKPEIAQDAGYGALVFHQGIVRVLMLLANSFVLYEIQLECGHLAFREQRRIFAQP